MKMKDPRTVPYLEELGKETTDERLLSRIKATIAHIKTPSSGDVEYGPSGELVYHFVVRASHPRKN
jgi:hypothetical protein